MIKISCTAVIILGLILLIGGASRLEAQSFGLGVIFGEPSAGLSLKFWPGHRTSFDAAFSLSSHDGETHVRFHGDILFNMFMGTSPSGGRLAFYYGLGLRYLQRGERLGLRFPLGLSFQFRRIPLELFGEFVPTLDLSPVTEFLLRFGAGLRLYL